MNLAKISGPYEVKAIGDRKYLESSLTIKNGYIDRVRANGKGIEYTLEDKIVITGYDGELNLKYSQEYKEQEEN